MGEAAAFNATDYKALVCLFMQGGNDHANTVVPYDAAQYGRYSTIRSSMVWASGDNRVLAKNPLSSTADSETIIIASSFA